MAPIQLFTAALENVYGWYKKVICHLRTTQQITTTGNWKHIFQN